MPVSPRSLCPPPISPLLVGEGSGVRSLVHGPDGALRRVFDRHMIALVQLLADAIGLRPVALVARRFAQAHQLLDLGALCSRQPAAWRRLVVQPDANRAGQFSER